MKIVQADDFSIRLSCPAKTREIVETYLPTDTTPALIPMPTRLKSSQAYCTEPGSSEADEIYASGYRTVVGKIGHLATTLRFDIVYAHRFLCEGMHAPGKTHQTVLLHLLRYLKGTCDFALTFPGGGDDSHSVSRGAGRFWRSCSRRHTVVPLSGVRCHAQRLCAHRPLYLWLHSLVSLCPCRLVQSTPEECRILNGTFGVHGG